MTTEEAMLIQVSAGHPGLTMLQVRGSRMMTHIPFQLQKRKKKKKKKANELLYPQAQSF